MLPYYPHTHVIHMLLWCICSVYTCIYVVSHTQLHFGVDLCKEI